MYIYIHTHHHQSKLKNSKKNFRNQSVYRVFWESSSLKPKTISRAPLLWAGLQWTDAVPWLWKNVTPPSSHQTWQWNAMEVPPYLSIVILFVDDVPMRIRRFPIAVGARLACSSVNTLDPLDACNPLHEYQSTGPCNNFYHPAAHFISCLVGNSTAS